MNEPTTTSPAHGAPVSTKEWGDLKVEEILPLLLTHLNASPEMPTYALDRAPLLADCLQGLGFACKLIGQVLRHPSHGQEVIFGVLLPGDVVIDAQGNRGWPAIQSTNATGKLINESSPCVEYWEPLTVVQLNAILAAATRTLNPDTIIASIHQQWLQDNTPLTRASPSSGPRL